MHILICTYYHKFNTFPVFPFHIRLKYLNYWFRNYFYCIISSLPTLRHLLTNCLWICCVCHIIRLSEFKFRQTLSFIAILFPTHVTEARSQICTSYHCIHLMDFLRWNFIRGHSYQYVRLGKERQFIRPIWEVFFNSFFFAFGCHGNSKKRFYLWSFFLIIMWYSFVRFRYGIICTVLLYLIRLMSLMVCPSHPKQNF